ncbi:glucosaminidase domain-containing protein [Streptomyces xiamenensis]|uniref:glucosaminidase domain-containing protein n=1 Tax=Streptomyces xiamenensis TaxID=408015 RepID=UPI00343BAE43
MGLPSPKKRKPTASEVAAWARSRIGKRLDVDGYYGAQCWDLPNYIFNRYWHFKTTGNAIAMAWYRYPKGFKFYRNTRNFVPKPGDMAVWGTGSFNNGTGHTAVVVGPSNKSYFTSVDQNWRNSNGYTGSPGSLEKHTYYGISGFVRPPYHAETKKPSKSSNTPSKPSNDNTPKNTKEQTKPITKEVTKVSYTSFAYDLDDDLEYIYHYMVEGQKLIGKVKGIYIKESTHMRSVEELYLQRNKYVNEDEYPHVYIDRERVWTPRPDSEEAPEHPGWLVMEVCGGQTESKRQFMLNQIRALIYGVWLLSWSKVKLSESSIKADPNIWRSMKDLINYDLIKNGIPDESKYKEVEKKIIGLYLKRDKLLTETITTTTTKTKIKIKPKTSVDNPSQNDKSTGKTTNRTSNKPRVVVEKSKYTFQQALNAQMAHGMPQKSYSWGWGNASRSQTSKYMNPNTIWNSSTQRYQMLDLGKYQGISVSKLNKILKGKGTLSGQGKAFADGCKKYNVNEIYLIAHAFLESGYGRSNYASGRYGIYNYFGIAAYDNNPNASIAYAKRQGWTNPRNAIIGGAKFVRKQYFNKGKNTLYRMRWNPKNPGYMQYATAIEWCNFQATTISSLYKKVGLKGMYYIRDKYR